MAKRERESEGRAPPPPRPTGLTLTSAALLATLAAAAFALLGALLAGSQSDTTATDAADSLGAGIAFALSAPEADWWSEGHGTTKDAWEIVKKAFGPGLPELD